MPWYCTSVLDNYVYLMVIPLEISALLLGGEVKTFKRVISRSILDPDTVSGKKDYKVEGTKTN